MNRRTVALALLVLVVAAGEASAHGRSVSHSRWRLGPNGGEVDLRLAERDVARRGIARPGEYAVARLVLYAGEAACTPGPVEPRRAPAGWLAYRWAVTCPEAERLDLDNGLFMEAAGARLHFARVELGDGVLVERVFGPTDRRLPIRGAAEAAQPAAPLGLWRFVTLGIEHILSGWDHLAFLIGLLVLAGTLRDVVVLASGFTIGHSVTLALSVLGLARPAGPAVEAVIGFSILLIAVENVWQVGGRGRAIPIALAAAMLALAVAAALGVGTVSVLTLIGLALFAVCHFGLLARAVRPARVRGLVASGFGLVHGFGFAGILHEMALPPEALVPALLGFNVGVEIGQLLVIVVLWPPVAVLARSVQRPTGQLVMQGTSAALAGLGAFWFVGRLLG